MYIFANAPEGCFVEKVIYLKELVGNTYQSTVKEVKTLLKKLMQQADLYQDKS